VEHFESYLRLQPDDPDGAALFLAALGARRPPKTYPENAARRLFDQMAERYDQQLVQGLGYQGHRLIYELLADRLQGGRGRRILDLGCGSGLCGAMLAPFASRLHGVDLSPKMVEKARELCVYDELAAEEAVKFLLERPAGYDVVAAGDVLVYMGELDDVFAAVRRSLDRGGLFAFTLEKSPDEPVALGISGRFAHAPDYVRAKAAQCGFIVLSLEDAEVRREEGRPVKGLAVLLQAGEDAPCRN
jgi:predicted TPR repeat methyltransferase